MSSGRLSRQAQFEAIQRILMEEPKSSVAIAGRIDVIDRMMDAISSREAIYEVLAREWTPSAMGDGPPICQLPILARSSQFATPAARRRRE